VPQEDAEAFAVAGLAMLADPARASAMGVAARERARSRFSMERIAEEYLAWYGALVGSRDRS